MEKPIRPLALTPRTPVVPMFAIQKLAVLIDTLTFVDECKTAAFSTHRKP